MGLKVILCKPTNFRHGVVVLFQSVTQMQHTHQANEANYKNHFHYSPYLFSIFSYDAAAIGIYLILVH